MQYAENKELFYEHHDIGQCLLTWQLRYAALLGCSLLFEKHSSSKSEVKCLVHKWTKVNILDRL